LWLSLVDHPRVTFDGPLSEEKCNSPPRQNPISQKQNKNKRKTKTIILSYNEQNRGLTSHHKMGVESDFPSLFSNRKEMSIPDPFTVD
jgi:hypothetical protein